uniref:MATE efflux family protein n=1 Tax=Tanacetum cinerariifolium TaxID=118510 RepID=A0A6L2NLP6_TANCI|nr:MATE efflux family protein [Tanacetum cinerariifolium]
MLWSSIVVVVIHVPICWALVFKLDFGAAGAALAIGISYTFNVILLVIYLYYSKSCEKTRVTCSGDVYSSIKEFFRFAIPSALIYLIHLSFAASTRISNELGAGNPEAAKTALLAVSALGVMEAIIAITTLFCSRSVLGYAFGNETELVDYVKDMTLFICFSIFTDTIQTILSGVARGTRWQHIGAYINLGSYYLVGIPMALILGFVLHLNGKGLWSGLIIGIARKARERMFEGAPNDEE